MSEDDPYLAAIARAVAAKTPEECEAAFRDAIRLMPRPAKPAAPGKSPALSPMRPMAEAPKDRPILAYCPPWSTWWDGGFVVIEWVAWGSSGGWLMDFAPQGSCDSSPPSDPVGWWELPEVPHD